MFALLDIRRVGGGGSIGNKISIAENRLICLLFCKEWHLSLCKRVHACAFLRLSVRACVRL